MINNRYNVPEIYAAKSRDFQVYLRLLDVIVNSTKYDTDKLSDLFDPKVCNDRVLDMLCTTLNFRPKIKFPDDDLRIILSGFGGLIRNKGTAVGLRQAISLVMKTQELNVPYVVMIKNKEYRYEGNEEALSGSEKVDVDMARAKVDYLINLELDEEINRTYLNELLEYVKPIGYTVDVYSASRSTFEMSQSFRDTATTMKSPAFDYQKDGQTLYAGPFIGVVPEQTNFTYAANSTVLNSNWESQVATEQSNPDITAESKYLGYLNRAEVLSEQMIIDAPEEIFTGAAGSLIADNIEEVESNE